MKTQLTAEESAKLIELGVSPERASERTPDYTDINNTGRPLERRELLPIFTLADLIGILPKEIEDYHLSIECFTGTYYATYIRDNRNDYLIPHKDSPELIDALYSLLVWCQEKGKAVYRPRRATPDFIREYCYGICPKFAPKTEKDE